MAVLVPLERLESVLGELVNRRPLYCYVSPRGSRREVLHRLAAPADWQACRVCDASGENSGPPSMRLALYQPDIPQNTGTILRLAACLAVPVDIIGPAGFDISDRNLRRAGLDYMAHVDLTRHLSWERFIAAREEPSAGRLVLLSSKADTPIPAFQFSDSDTLLFGRESSGVPDAVRQACDHTVRIPMRTPLRSLNVAVAAAMVLGEALRQTGGFPTP